MAHYLSGENSWHILFSSVFINAKQHLPVKNKSLRQVTVQLPQGSFQGGDTRFYTKPRQRYSLSPAARRDKPRTHLPSCKKQRRLTCPDIPRVFCCLFPTLQCPKCPSCQRSSESQTLPATADLHSYTVSRKHAVIIFIFLKCHSSQQQLRINVISKPQEIKITGLCLIKLHFPFWNEKVFEVLGIGKTSVLCSLNPQSQLFIYPS